ncbi:hypothetical protein RJ640_023452 [Escallonia rubra]|uniref:Uncharacterized protein n=1 Tax=Escallonia rubra TaxID=112253 RepID=A0AA88UUR9_9ASTE|nr:hypothetical protein RJ640_023452 [Escallonia rubra]
MGSFVGEDEGLNQGLLQDPSGQVQEDCQGDLKTRFWIESKKLWHIVGPSIFSRVAIFSMNIVSQAFAGHLGDLELASISIANTVIVGFNFGLLYLKYLSLFGESARNGECIRDPMWASLRGQKVPHAGDIHAKIMDCSVPVLFLAVATVRVRDPGSETVRATGRCGGANRPGGFVAYSIALQLRIFVPSAESQLKTAVLAWVSLVVLVINVFISWLFVYRLNLGVVGAAVALDISWWLLFFGQFGYCVWGGCPNTWTGFSIQAFSGLWEFLKLSAASGVMLWYDYIKKSLGDLHKLGKLVLQGADIDDWGPTGCNTRCGCIVYLVSNGTFLVSKTVDI